MKETTQSSLDINNIKERFPGNNDTPAVQENKPERKQMTGNTEIAKDTPTKSFFRVIFKCTPKELWDDVLKDKLDMIIRYGAADILHCIIDQGLIGGDPRYKKDPRERSSLYHGSYSGRAIGERSQVGKGDFFFKEVFYDNPTDAHTVKDDLLEQVQEYGKVNVAKYLELSDHAKDIEDTDYSWGWRKGYLDDLDVRPISGGRYILTLPKPQPL